MLLGPTYLAPSTAPKMFFMLYVTPALIRRSSATSTHLSAMRQSDSSAVSNSDERVLMALLEVKSDTRGMIVDLFHNLEEVNDDAWDRVVCRSTAAAPRVCEIPYFTWAS
jgi:hypothetical protein